MTTQVTDSVVVNASLYGVVNTENTRTLIESMVSDGLQDHDEVKESFWLVLWVDEAGLFVRSVFIYYVLEVPCH
jgi:hypothetical protein